MYIQKYKYFFPQQQIDLSCNKRVFGFDAVSVPSDTVFTGSLSRQGITIAAKLYKAERPLYIQHSALRALTHADDILYSA